MQRMKMPDPAGFHTEPFAAYGGRECFCARPLRTLPEERQMCRRLTQLLKAKYGENNVKITLNEPKNIEKMQ